jgi:HK97 family phage portal protein
VIGRLFAKRAVQDPGWAAWARGDDVVALGDTGGQLVNTTTAMQLLAVYGCVTLIADTIATMPVHTVGGAITDNPRWLERPNPDMDRVDFMGATVASLLTDGNAYIAVMRDASNRPDQLQLLNPARVHCHMVDGRIVHMVDGRPYLGEMLTVRGLMLPGAMKGLSPIDHARQIVGLGLGAQDQASRFFAQGAVVPGVIQSAGNLTKEQMREIRDQWIASHGGSRRSHLPVVLTGDAKWQGITMTQEQAQFLETRRYTDAQIAGQLFKVDPTMLGIPVEGTSLTYSNLEQRGTHLVRHTLLPWIVRLERAFTRLLPNGQQLKFNVAGLLRADLETRYRSYEIAARVQQMTGEAFLTVDEMREFEDLEVS